MKKPPVDYQKALTEWALDEQRLLEKPEDFLYSLTAELNRLDLKIGVASVCIRTLHPQLDMFVMRWRPIDVDEVPTENTSSILQQSTTKREDGVLDIYPLVHGHTDEAMWQTSPFFWTQKNKRTLRVRLPAVDSPEPFPILDDLQKRGMTDYLVVRMPAPQQVTAFMSIATLRPGGFPESFVDSFEAFRILLALSAAHKVERLQFQQVLSAYIGQDPARRVLNGQIRRGDLIRRKAAIGFADLRGFTSASQKLESKLLLDLIGSFFEQVHHCVYQFNGEILKFMGDGILFIFADEDNSGKTCDRAMLSIKALKRNIEKYNAKNEERAIRFGCGMHFGEVLYGNIGSPSRLDFTVIGSAVNITSRIESLTSRVGEVLLLSKCFAEQTTHRTRLVGQYQMKGIAGAQPVFAPEKEQA